MTKLKYNSILIVEDELLIAECIRLELKRLNVHVLGPVATGEDAVSTALEKHPDLILMDVGLAGKLDGIAAAEQINRQQPIPIMFMTGHDPKLLRKNLGNIKLAGILQKPVRVDEIFRDMELA